MRRGAVRVPGWGVAAGNPRPEWSSWSAEQAKQARYFPPGSDIPVPDSAGGGWLLHGVRLLSKPTTDVYAKVLVKLDSIKGFPYPISFDGVDNLHGGIGPDEFDFDLNGGLTGALVDDGGDGLGQDRALHDMTPLRFARRVA